MLEQITQKIEDTVSAMLCSGSLPEKSSEVLGEDSDSIAVLGVSPKSLARS